MSELLNIVKSRLQKEICSEHQKKASITLRGENLSLDCCCDSFREKMVKKMTTETEKATFELISKMFNK